MNKVLVTGAAGFVGQYLVERFAEGGWTVVGLDTAPNRSAEHYRSVQCDIKDEIALQDVIRSHDPDLICHLAGLLRADTFRELYDSNVDATRCLCESILASECDIDLIVVSSSAVYGRGISDAPLSEQAPTRPITEYGLSKLMQEQVALLYNDRQEFSTMVLRLFNLVGFGMSSKFAIPSFIDQMTASGDGNGVRNLKVGNIGTVRDYVDVRDAAEAIYMAGQNVDRGGIYNICSGRGTQMDRVIELIGKLLHRECKLEVTEDLVQTHDVPVQIGDSGRFSAQYGWAPRYTLEQSLEAMCEAELRN